MRMPDGIKWCFVATVVALSASMATAQQSQKVDDKALKNASRNGDDWLTNGRDYQETRYSPLKQIDASNVGKLGLAWYYDTDSDRGTVETTPIESNGTLYATLPWSVA